MIEVQAKTTYSNRIEGQKIIVIVLQILVCKDN